MKFRTLNITKVVFQILRSNYAVRMNSAIVNGIVTFSVSLSDLYKYIVCCLYDITEYFEGYCVMRKRAYMIAACMPVQGQAMLVLNNLFGQYGVIYLSDGQNYQSIYFYDAASSTPANQVYLYTDDQNKPLYLGFAGAAANRITVFVPKELQNDTNTYSDFIAILNSLIMYGLIFNIKTYGGQDN